MASLFSILKIMINFISMFFAIELIVYGNNTKFFRFVFVGEVIAVPWHEPWSRKVKEIFFKVILVLGKTLSVLIFAFCSFYN